MQAVLDSFLAGFPILLLHSSVTLVILVVGVFIYIWMTPWDELTLIRSGNTAAAVSLGGRNSWTCCAIGIRNGGQRQCL